MPVSAPIGALPEEPPLIFVAFLFPVAVYCLVLGLINRGSRPLMVSAAWDFVGLLFAASGFLVFGLPALLSGFTEHGRRLVLFGRPPSGEGGAWPWFWDHFDGLCSSLFAAGGAVMLAYFAVVVLGSAYVLWRRQGQTAIYNVHPDMLDEVLAGVLDVAGLTWSRAANRYFIGRAEKLAAPTADEVEDISQTSILRPEHLPPPAKRGSYPTSAEDIERSAYLEVDPSPALCHVTLRWEAQDGDLRKLVEGELERALAEVRTRHNPAGVWLLTIGTVLLLSTVMVFVFVVLRRVFYGV
jgi:hypothetical protein